MIIVILVTIVLIVIIVIIVIIYDANYRDMGFTIIPQYCTLFVYVYKHTCNNIIRTTCHGNDAVVSTVT